MNSAWFLRYFTDIYYHKGASAFWMALAQPTVAQILVKLNNLSIDSNSKKIRRVVVGVEHRGMTLESFGVETLDEARLAVYKLDPVLPPKGFDLGEICVRINMSHSKVMRNNEGNSFKWEDYY